MTQTNENIVRSAVILIAVVAIAYLVNTLTSRFLTSYSVDRCINASRTEVKNTDGSSWNGPNDSWYERCMDANGLDAK